MMVFIELRITFKINQGLVLFRGPLVAARTGSPDRMLTKQAPATLQDGAVVWLMNPLHPQIDAKWSRMIRDNASECYNSNTLYTKQS